MTGVPATVANASVSRSVSSFSRSMGTPISLGSAARITEWGCERTEDDQRGEVLGGIEWAGIEETDPDELPSPELLDIRAA
ncbi:hypothetical protein KBX08_32485 [Micromonospora sp. H61]|uniref:hypothetical protein n=1 Tax=Micromonospora sp. H61 TaxID=2824888 RepID=UPI001B37C21E|nr:hypothetical protein [Micromonospora sp. H61]MBQ0994779.1 hypothetical protein [Micromonospora sp. H61]